MAEDNVAKKAVAKKAPVKRAAKKVAAKESNALEVLLEAVKVARENGVVVQGSAVLLTNDVTTERNL
jgi:hypothetical protein